MPARLAQQEDENKVGRASVTKSPVARRMANLACRASVHGVPAPPLPKFDFLGKLRAGPQLFNISVFFAQGMGFGISSSQIL